MRKLLLAAAIAGLTLAGCDDIAGNKSQSPPLVTAYDVASYRFVNRIEAVGTAYAREQVVLAAPVTERIVRLNFNDGAHVQAGQVIAELANGQEVATLADARARAREAEQQLVRLRELRSRGFATNASLDSQVAAAESARAQADQAQAMIGDRIIRAPFAGYVSLRRISPGAIVQAGTEIATIADLGEIKLDFEVPETMLSSLSDGQTIFATAAAYPQQRFSGKIASISPIVDPATRSVLVRARLPNPDHRLLPGMLMTVAVQAAPRQQLAVPELSVVSEGDSRYVYVIDAQSKARRVAVKTGTRMDGLVEITQGLKAGQRVVGEGVVKVSDGLTVHLAGKEKPATAAADNAE